MAANKEAIAIILDIGPSMNQAPPGETTSLQTSLDAITMILQRKMFAESKDEISIVLVGTPDTDNPLADGTSYENITIAHPMSVADFDMLQFVQNDVQPSNISGDFLDGIVVAMDHMMNALQGKKGFGFKRVILFSDLGGEFGDDQLDTICAGIRNAGIELNVIGPHYEQDNEVDGMANGHRKERTSQQKTGEAMIKYILDEVDGECYSFQEALPALAFFQSRQVRPTAWKCPLEVSSQMKIPICGYLRVKDYKLKQSWKRVYARDPDMEVKDYKLKQSWKRVYARDPDMEVGTLRTYHKNDEEETEVEKEDMVEGHRYGNTLVPMTDDDKANMKYKAEKCFKVLGFTKAENIKRHEMMGDGTMAVVAEKGDTAASVALSALINAMYETNTVAIVRRVYDARSSPKVGCLVPHIKVLYEAASLALSALINAMYETNTVAIVRRVYDARSSPKVGCLVPHIKVLYECLYWFELPYSEDIRQFTFGSLPVKEENPTNKKFKPTNDQLSAIDGLIDSMDLSTASQDEAGEKCEGLRPKLTFNPHYQRLYQCLQHRALNPDDPLPDLSPLIANYLKPPEEIVATCGESVEKLKQKFKLEVVKKKEEKTGENLFKDNEEAGGEPAAKKLKVDDSLDGGMRDIAKAKVTEVGSASPIEDFFEIIGRKDEDKFEDACGQMTKRIQQIVMDSFGDQFYEKALDCLKCLREQCIKKSGVNLYNTFMKEFKEVLISKARRDFFDQLCTAGHSLISKMESEDSAISEAESKEFSSGEATQKEESEEEEDSDDLMGEL